MRYTKYLYHVFIYPFLSAQLHSSVDLSTFSWMYALITLKCLVLPIKRMLYLLYLFRNTRICPLNICPRKSSAWVRCFNGVKFESFFPTGAGPFPLHGASKKSFLVASWALLAETRFKSEVKNKKMQLGQMPFFCLTYLNKTDDHLWSIDCCMLQPWCCRECWHANVADHQQTAIFQITKAFPVTSTAAFLEPGLHSHESCLENRIEPKLIH